MAKSKLSTSTHAGTSPAAKNTGSRGARKRLGSEIGPVARSAGRQIERAWQATAKAAGKTTRIVTLRAKASTRELTIQGLFYKIGEAFYRAHKAGKSLEDSAAVLQPLVEQVDTLNKEITSLKQREKKIRSAK